MLRAWNSRSSNLMPTLLDWVKGDGITYVQTDILFEDVRNMVSADIYKETYEGTDPDGLWRGIMFAGCQHNAGLQFALTNMTEDNGRSRIAEMWYYNWIYWDRRGQHSDRLRYVSQVYKQSDSVGLLDVYYRKDQNQFVLADYPNWTVAQRTDKKQITFFGTLKDGAIAQQSSKCRVYGIKVHQLQSDKILLDFVPAMIGNVAGMYERLSKRFYPEDPSGKLVCCLNGEVLSR